MNSHKRKYDTFTLTNVPETPRFILIKKRIEILKDVIQHLDIIKMMCDTPSNQTTLIELLRMNNSLYSYFIDLYIYDSEYEFNELAEEEFNQAIKGDDNLKIFHPQLQSTYEKYICFENAEFIDKNAIQGILNLIKAQLDIEISKLEM